jgi:hypothetical protein
VMTMNEYRFWLHENQFNGYDASILVFQLNGNPFERELLAAIHCGVIWRWRHEKDILQRMGFHLDKTRVEGSGIQNCVIQLGDDYSNRGL